MVGKYASKSSKIALFLPFLESARNASDLDSRIPVRMRTGMWPDNCVTTRKRKWIGFELLRAHCFTFSLSAFSRSRRDEPELKISEALKKCRVQPILPSAKWHFYAMEKRFSLATSQPDWLIKGRQRRMEHQSIIWPQLSQSFPTSFTSSPRKTFHRFILMLCSRLRLSRELNPIQNTILLTFSAGTKIDTCPLK